MSHQPASPAEIPEQGFRISPTPVVKDVVVAAPMENTQDPPDFEVREAPPLKSLFAAQEAGKRTVPLGLSPRNSPVWGWGAPRLPPPPLGGLGNGMSPRKPKRTTRR